MEGVLEPLGLFIPVGCMRLTLHGVLVEASPSGPREACVGAVSYRRLRWVSHSVVAAEVFDWRDLNRPESALFGR